MDYHPGGEEELMKAAGIDGTDLFEQVHRWVNYESMLKECLVGRMIVKASTAIKGLGPPDALMLDSVAAPPAPKDNRPRYDWFQTEETVNIVIYTKRKIPRSGCTVVDSHGNILRIEVLLGRWSYLLHWSLSYEVEENVNVQTLSSVGKVEVCLRKVLKAKWAQVGQPLESHDSFIQSKQRGLFYRECVLVSKKEVTHDTQLFGFRLPPGAHMNIPVGRHVYLKASVQGSDVVKPYTPVDQVLIPQLHTSNTLSSEIYLMIKVYPDGAFTQRLHNLDIGATVSVSGPEGPFTLRRLCDVTHLYLLAAGTGFTPMARLLCHVLQDLSSIRKTKLMFFNRQERDILWYSQLEQLCAEEERFQVEHVLSEPAGSWTGKSGRIDATMLQAFLERPTDSKCLVCVCGPTDFTELAVQFFLTRLAVLAALVTVPLSHIVNAVHSLKASAVSTATAAVQSLHRELSAGQHRLAHTPDPQLKHVYEDLGISELNLSGVTKLQNRLLPTPTAKESSELESCLRSSRWRTSHTSTDSFFHNKHGFSQRIPEHFGYPIFHKQHSLPLQGLCSDLQDLHVWVQSRGFKTVRSKSSQSSYESPAEPESYTQMFIKGLLMRHKSDAENLDQFMKQRNLSKNQQDAFKAGFTEGFMKSQVLMQKTQVRFRTTSGLDAALDPIQMKNVTFEHVKGAEEAKSELQDIVEFLRNPQKFTALGGKLPKGVLLVGPPGTGKTLLARAVAGEADVPFFYASGSEFDEMFVGVGASRIRNLFREAKVNAPCVIFIDELDSVGGKRIESPMHPYSRQTINQLLAEMDGFKPNEGVIVIGATNFAEALDNALVRPGRFDMQVTVPRPDVKGRTEILNWYLKKIKVDPDVDAELIARGTVGFSGAELENLVNQAALKAAVDGKEMVTIKELEFAKDKIVMGPERRSVEIDKKNKTITAYHESGHAIVAYYTKDAMPINKATIMPRGPSLGHVSMLPENDRWSETRAQLLAQMDVSMGGRVAEELIFGNENITTGASSDFDGATEIAKMMVTRFGMSAKLGVMTYSDLSKHSPETQAAVDQEVRMLLQDSYERAKKLLKTYSKEHKKLADALLTHETLNAKEIQMVLEGKSLDPR
ncbi:ATP-dependent zinc metalloprotease YME1L1 [Bagarius yarrelli]|uniref:ATP-dependent zinc metalloprotease YME1L1 n=1 Tax=Bagarius yarrelli TaxID=175774 RepID=A0A556TQA7_BAGYA|nr:ATP-dependent zinc metalloprotease YME1L1 [Bagarius yarrelli]